MCESFSSPFIVNRRGFLAAGAALGTAALAAGATSGQAASQPVAPLPPP